MDDNKKKLYDALSKDYDMGTYEQFCKDIQDSGKRKRLYDATSKDYDYGSFDSFNKQLGFVATAKPAVPANSQSKPSAPQKPVQKPTAATRPAQKPRQTGTPLTEADKQKMLGETSQMLAQTQAGLQRTKNRMDYMSANTGLQVPKVKLGEKGGGIKLGQNNKVVSRKKLNPETGKEEQTFITESGNEFDNRAEADLEQNSVDDARYQLEHREDWLRQQRRVLAARLAKRGEELDAEAVNFSWRDMPRGSGGAIHTYNSSTVNGRFADTQYKNMLAQIKKIDDTLATLEEARKGIASDKWIDDSSSWAAKKGKQLLAFGAGAWRGLAHAVGKVSTWDLGLTDINTNGSVLDASQNADRVGFDNISQDERDLLNLTAISNEVQSENADHIGRGYKAGEVTGESLPFMLEMILNPASGLGEAAVKRMTQEAIKRFGKEAVKKAAKKYLAAKIGTRLIGDAAGSAVMAGTSGLGHVTADTLNRLTGDVQFKQDETGHIVYGGREGAEDSVAKAFLKAFGAQTIENHSEMVGEYFAPLLGKASKVVRKGMDKVGLGSVNRFIDNVGATNFAKMIGDFEKHSKWNGTIGEYAEEVVGNIENALLVGDNTLDTAKNTGVFNLDQNIDTFLGVSLMGGFLSGAKTLSYRGPKRQAMNEMSEAGKAIDHAIGGDIHWMEKWGGWRNTFLVGTDEEKTAALREVMDNTDLPIGFRMGVLNFVKAAQKYEGLTRAQESKLQNGEQDPVAAGYDESYDRGYDTTEPEAMNDAKNLLDMKRGQLAQQLGIENADEVDDYIGDPLHYIDEQRRLGNTAGLHTVIDYANAKSAYEGMLERVRDDIDSRVEESDHTVDSHVNRTDGMIHPATLKEQNEDGTDKNVYIVSGNVVMTDDGSGVDTEKSDDTIVIRDAQTGEMQQIAPDAIFHVDDAIDPEEEKATAAEAIRQEMAQQAANNVDGTLPFAFGDSYTLTAPDGSQQSIAIVANEQGVVDNGDGTVNVTVDGQTVVPMSKEEIQQGVNATNMERTAQAEQERLAQQAETEQQRQAAEAEASRPQYGVNDIFTVTDENGMPIRGNVQGITGDGVEIYTEAPLNGKRVQMVPVEEFEGMVDSISDANGNPIWAREAVEQPTGDHIVDINNMVEDVEAGENKPSEASLSPTTPLTEEGATAEGEAPLTDEAAPTEHQPSALERVPKNEKGEPIYEQTDPATAWDAIVEQTGGNEQMAKTVADSMVADKETALKKAEKAKAKQGGTIAEKIAAEQERQAAIDNAKAELKHWQSIAMTQQSRRADAEREGRTESNSGRSENSQGNRGLQEQRDEGVQEVHVGLGEKETDGLLSQMEANAAEMPQLELNPSNWVSQFGEEGTVRTPIGQVKMGVNQIAKLFEKGRSEQFGMIKPTLENPQVIIEVPSESNDGNTERSSSLLFVKTFVGKDGKKIYYFKSVTVKKDGLEVSVSSHYDRVKRVKEALKNGKLLYRFDGGAQTEHHPADVSVTTSHEKGQGFSSADKVTNNHRELQTNNEKNTGREEDSLSSKIAAASEEVNTEPTEAQKEAGNYKKGHVQVGTFDITIEQREGSIRRGTDANGKQWESKMHNTYGYFRGTEGVDGDHIDVFLSTDIDGWNGHKVYVVDQYNPDGTFDEHKVMLGFNDMDEAKSDYLANYEKGWENGRRIDVTAVNLEDFEKWIASSHRKTKPFGEYSSVKKDTDTTVKTGAYTIAPAQYTTKRGKVLDMQLVKFANELSKEQQRAAAAMAKEMKGWYDRAQGGFLMRSEEDARKLAEAVAENGEQLADAAPLSVSDLQEADEKQKEIGKAVEQTISDIVDTLSKDKVVVGTLKNSPNNPAFENLVYEKAQAIIIGDTERNLSNGVLKAFDNNELYRKIEKLVRERVNEDIFQKAERIAKEEEKKRTVKKPKSKEKEKPKNSGQFGLVSDERMEELKKRLRQKLGGQLNMGIDPEILAIGMELAAGHIDRGIKKFADFAKVMVEDMGDVIRPYLKAFYNGARDMPEVGDNGLAAEMTPYDEVRTFDVANFDKATPDALATAEQVVAEHEAEKQAKTATKKLKEKRNEAAKKLKTSKPAKEAADNFYDNGINEDAVAALPEDDAIHLHVVDILNPGMTDNSMKSKIDNFTYLLPKISDGKLAELDKEYGDDKIMGSHIKAEINRREEAKIDATDLPKLAKEKAKSALHGNGSMTDNAALAEAKRRIDKKRKTKTPQTEQRSLFDEPITNENDNGLQRDDDAVRTEAVQADRSGHGEGLSERTESGSKASEKGREAVDGTGARKGTGTDRTVQPRPANAVKEKRNTRNNHAERGEEFAPKSVDARIDANIKAIELAHELLESGEIATPEQMAVLRRFSGWGGLGAAFGDGGYDWKRRERNQKIRELLGNEAYEQAVLSANSAYYTPAYVVDTLWDIAAQLGFKGGRILEGSAGIGNILGQMPTAVSERSNIHAVEIDGTSGGILSLLYPDAKVEIQGFEQTRIPNGSVDLAITNVPFVAGMRVKDTTGDSDLAKKFYIQDFCIAKNVRKLREGGLGIFITSNGTLDSSKKLREWVTNEGGADFVGAFRMNNKTFGGTPVTSDIIVIRKRVNGQPSPNAIDVSTISGERMAEYDTGETRKVKGKEVPVVKQLSMDYNKYFIEHPENMAGEMHFGFEKGDTYRPTSKGLYPMSGKEQKQMLESFVLSLSKEEGAEKSTAPSADEVNSMVYDKLGKDVKEGSMVVDKNGRICLAQYGEAVPVMSKPKTGENASEEELIKRFQYKKIKKHTKAECFQSYSEIKTALNDVLAYQKENEGDEGLQPLLDKLNKAYDDFVKTYGHFNKNGQLAWLRRDVDYANVASVETFEERGDKNGNLVQTFGKADVMNGRVVEKEQEPHPENVKDGVVVSMFQSGRIDVPYIASQLGMSEEDVKQEIIDSGLGFEDPASRQMEVSYQYLSGNVREKLRLARENNEGGRYDKNIKALEDVKPMDIPSHLIDFTLGSSWIDSKLYDEYVKDRTDVDVYFTAVGGTWFMNAPEYGLNMEKNRAMGVTSEMLHRTVFGHALIEAAIQNRTITVSQTQKKWDGTTETITDREATQACAAKIDEIRQDFKEWARQKMQSDAEMSQRMERVYNDTFNKYVPMRIPDDFVPEYFGGASHKFKMRPHQGRAIVRGTMQPLLLAHEVGTGKTFTLISTAMEMRRLGTAHKPMIVVQNATVGQFVASAKELYPNAKILTLEDADRNAEGRKNFYAMIKYNDWDMIVVPQSTFEFIPDSEEREMAFVQDKIHEKEMVLEKMRETDKKGNSMILRQAERELNDLNNQLATLSDKASKKRNANDEKKKAVARQNATVKAQEMLDRRTDDVDNFDDMGIDALLIDEAHEYKHLGFATAMQRGVKGVDSSYSKKSQGVYLKTQAVLEKNHGRNVVFATGTPISNTAAEIWTFMRYLMPKDTMEEYGIYYFDDFVRNFGNIQQMLEFTTSGKFKENNRFAGYVNLPELVRIWSSVSDTVLTREAGGVKEKIPELEGGKAQDLYLPQTRALRSIMKYVKHQLDEYDKMSGKEKKENSHIPLTMYGIAKAAAVDARLVQSDAEDDGNSKTNEAVRQTLRSLKETESYKGTVAIFADNYQNKHSGFNLYEDIRQKLIEQGVPANEIVVMKSGMTVKKKLDIFDKVNRGEVRVILGSTFTLGTGVNIQERLHTLIHLDAPNRPMDYTQRNGRILRQGNLHKEMGKPVRVLRFGVEDSLDVTAYQRLKTKGAIADSVMNGKELMQDSMNNRVLEEDEDVFGDTVAQLSGSEYAMLKNNAEKNVRKYESRRKQWEADQTYIHNAKPRLEGKIKADKERAEKANKHLFAVQTAFPDGKAGSIKVGKKEFASVDAMADFIKEHNKKILDEVKAMKDNPKDETRTHTLTLSMGGYDFTVKTEMQREMSSGGGQLFAEVHRKMTYSCQELGLENVPVKQSLLRNAIEDITENVITGKDFAEQYDAATRSMKHNQSELEQIRQREGKTFEYEKELEEAKRQYIEYSEAMKHEMEEKEKKYAEMDKDVAEANDVEYTDEEDDDADEDMYRIVDDEATIERLDSEPKMTAYRAMQVIDGRLYSPMAAKVDGKLTADNPVGAWTEAEETVFDFTPEQKAAMEKLDNSKKKGDVEIIKGKLRYHKESEGGRGTLQFHLVKGDGTSLWAAYNPYIHRSLMMLNDQFTSAYKRPNIVVVEVEIPKSELTSGYRAERAKDPVGIAEWKAGPVAGQLPSDMGRKVMLSRWSKVKRIVPYAEVADHVASILEAAEAKNGERLTLPIDSFHPELRKELEKRGFKFEYGQYTKEKTDKNGNVQTAWDEKSDAEKRKAYKGASYMDDAAINELKSG